MRGERLRQGRKRARRVLRVRRACQLDSMREREGECLADDGPLEQVMRFTRIPCSGSCCGNPRRYWGERTRQERRADAKMRAELETVRV